MLRSSSSYCQGFDTIRSYSSSSKLHENHLDPKNIENSVIDQLELDREEVLQKHWLWRFCFCGEQLNNYCQARSKDSELVLGSSVPFAFLSILKIPIPSHTLTLKIECIKYNLECDQANVNCQSQAFRSELSNCYMQ